MDCRKIEDIVDKVICEHGYDPSDKNYKDIKSICDIIFNIQQKRINEITNRSDRLRLAIQTNVAIRS